MKKLLVTSVCALMTIVVGAQRVLVVEQNDSTVTRFNVENIRQLYFEQDTLDKSPFGLRFQDLFGIISSAQDWNMAVPRSVVVTVPSTSKVTIFGTFVSSQFGSKKLAEYTDVAGTQVLYFLQPKGLDRVFAIASNDQYSAGVTIDDSGVANFTGLGGETVLANCVTTGQQDVAVDEYALQLLPDGSNNTGKVTQSSKFVSDGKTVTVVPVYSNCGYTNTFGIYLQKGDGSIERLNLWTKTQNHTYGVLSRPVFHITLPEGAVYGFYISNSGGTYYSDAALNTNSARAAGIVNGNGHMYIAFEDMPLSGDMDYNDMVFRIEESVAMLDNDPSEWVIAAEVDDENSDFDFNDFVIKVTYVMGNSYMTITPMAVGTNKSIQAFWGGQLLGEAHMLFGVYTPQCINTVGEGNIYRGPVNTKSINIQVPQQFSVTDALKNISVKVDDRVLSVSNVGFSPRFLLIANGQWRWPTEGTSIGVAYPGFAKWVSDPGYINWIFE